jgi:hypothetical protein
MFADEGNGFAAVRGLMQCSLLTTALLLLLPLHCRALADRLKWAITEVLGGKEAFTLMLCSLLTTALLCGGCCCCCLQGAC